MSKSNQTSILAMLHARSASLEKGEPLSPPIVSAAKFALPGDPQSAHPYGRYANPTVETCEQAISALEDAPSLAFPSGMAAITAAIMATTKPGDTVLLPSDGYYTVRDLMQTFFPDGSRNMVTVPTRNYASVDLMGVDAVWAETPSNPGLDLCDVAALATRTKAAGLKLIVDNTTLTPLLQRPLDLGADMIVSSDTKAMSGHSDLLFGHVSTRDEDLLERVRDWRKMSGAITGPFEAFLVYRGLMTLELRLERMCATTAALVERIRKSSHADRITFPDIGFIIGLTFDTAAKADEFIDHCPLVFPSTSFGGIHTSAERRARWGDDVAEGYVRLCIGCEPSEPLIEAIFSSLTRTMDQTL